MQDTGLGIERTDDVVLVTVTSRPRERAMKEAFYSRLVTALGQHCDLRPEDLVVSITENTDEDWSFGHGRAQFPTGEALTRTPTTPPPASAPEPRVLTVPGASRDHEHEPVPRRTS